MRATRRLRLFETFRAEGQRTGVDIAVIALWLGHESIETTNAYVHANLAMKEKALGKVLPLDTPFRPTKTNSPRIGLNNLAASVSS